MTVSHLVYQKIDLMLYLAPHSTVVLIGIEPPTNHNITEGVDQTVENCVVISVPDMNVTIQRSDFSVCLSTGHSSLVDRGAWVQGYVHRVKCFSILIE